MNRCKYIPMIIAPYSGQPGGIGSWTKNLMEYSESGEKDFSVNIKTYGNNLKKLTNRNSLVRIITGLIIYSKLLVHVFIFLIKYRPSILHVTSSSSFGLIKDLLIIWVATSFKTPVVIHWHFGRIPTLFQQKNWEWKLIFYVIRKSSYNIVIDLKSYDILENAGTKNVTYVPNPIGYTVEQKSKNIFDPISKRKQNRLIFVGQLIRTKGIFELIEACTQIPTLVELVLIGPEKEGVRKQLEEIAKFKQNGSWLKIVGVKAIEDVLEEMKSSSILVLPSYTEGFPYVILEAMAMGCAVIATDVGAIPEMLAFGSEKPCGICIPVQNVDKLKAAISSLFNNPDEAYEMAQNGIKRVHDNYTLGKVMKQYKDIWYNVLHA